MQDMQRCDVCGTARNVEQLVEAEIIGKVRVVCRDCHEHLSNVW